MPFDDLSKSDLEKMTVAMRESGLAYNTVATNVRMVRAFLHWCQREGLTTLDIPNFKERETVKETYTDEELTDPFEEAAEGRIFCRVSHVGDRKLLISCDSGSQNLLDRTFEIRDIYDYDSIIVALSRY